MSKIKVGQIYRTPITNYKMVVTYVENDKVSEPFNTIIGVYKDGYGVQMFQQDMEGMQLIAEYPTWQEAVNSKEFNK